MIAPDSTTIRTSGHVCQLRALTWAGPTRHAWVAAVFLCMMVNPGIVGASDPIAHSNTPDSSASHWAFEPPRAVTPPQVKHRRWIQSPIDAFILARLEAAGLTPARSADKSTLLRRVTFDLIGLPPTPNEIDAFLSDTSTEAFARIVDRLLASPHYGERWGRHWLDVARYADSNGQDENKAMSQAWRYRDHVIAAFNRDQPFDQFIREQLAGDLLPSSNERETFAHWTATGFLVLGPKMLAEQDKPKLLMDVVDEQIDVVSRAFLGLTISCSRCHDHKFDPIPTRDYYALAGIFKSTKTMGDLAFVSKWNERTIATQEERVRFEDYVKRTNELERARAETIREADAAVRNLWRARALDYWTAANECRSRPDGALDTNLVDSVAHRMDLHRGTLERWVQRLAGRQTNQPPLDTHAMLALLGDSPALSTSPSATKIRFGRGRIGSGLRCSGSNFVEIPDHPELEPANLTVEAWVLTERPPKDGDRRRWIVNKNINEWSDGHYALMVDGPRAGAYLNIGGGRENEFVLWSDEAAVPVGQWRHIAFTYDGADLRLFVNGQASGLTNVGRARVPGHTSLQIARRQDGYNFFSGGIDEVRIYRRALSGMEIRQRAEEPDKDLREGLVRHWSFEPTTEAERAEQVQEELRELLLGADGLLVPPKDSRPFYLPDFRERLEAIDADWATLRSNAPPPLPVVLAAEESKPVDLPVYLRGSHLNPGPEKVPRGFVQILNRAPAPHIPTSQSGRLQLADWLTDPQHPLTARVTVNRIWQAHFGEGLVRTPDNFGLRGEAPTHPELLDWLARDLIRSGWSIKQLHRTMVLSSTYQMSSAFDPQAANLDPDNRLLWRMNRRRLEAEPLRDALLAVSGRLDLGMGGSLVTWANAEYVPGDATSASSLRRAVYLPVVRDRVYDVFTIFDFANPSVGVCKRTPTVVTHQALFFLNSPLVKEQSKYFAQLVLAHPDRTDAERVNVAYRRALGRPAGRAEVQQALAYVERAQLTLSGNSVERTLSAWASLCQALLASNEFLYVD
jgi:hypothetical protein